MQKLPDNLNQNFTQILMDRKLPKPDQYFCTKWLRYYWDFCYKYHHNPFLSLSLPLFLGKLQEKKQSVQQQNQTQFAINLLYEMNSPTPGKQNIALVDNHSYKIQDNNKNYNGSVAKSRDKPGNENVSYASTSIDVTPQSTSVSDQKPFPETSGQSSDCKGVVIRKSIEEKAEYLLKNADQCKPASIESSSSKKRNGKKKMAVLGAVYTVEPNYREPGKVLESLFRPTGEPSPYDDNTSRPKPLDKHVRASMHRDKADTLQPAREEIFNWLEQEYHERNPRGKSKNILLMDGE